MTRPHPEECPKGASRRTRAAPSFETPASQAPQDEAEREIRSSSMNPITLLVTVVLGAIGALLVMAQMPQAGAVFFILAALTLFSLKMANNWERFVILRAGKLSSVKRPGLFMICLLYTSPSPRDGLLSRMPSSA